MGKTVGQKRALTLANIKGPYNIKRIPLGRCATDQKTGLFI
jgi:hypothetical protein